MSPTTKKLAFEAIEWLKTPSPSGWVAGRIATLLSHYFVTKDDERLAKAAAEDWIEILKPAPPWAIANACRKYLAGENARRKPLPADILSLAYQEMGFLNRYKLLAMEMEKQEKEKQQEKQEKKKTPEEMKAFLDGLKQKYKIKSM